MRTPKKATCFEWIVLKWFLWVFVSSLILGGSPWIFPDNGRYLIESLWQKNEPYSRAASYCASP